MCDTIVALPTATAGRITLFGKNSDRERNEAQAVERFPRAEHAAGTNLRCTYIDIPQARRTHAVLLCRPFWMWGAEMGANEHGVVIGNEAVHARLGPAEESALLGMDLLRLGLERGATAAEALETIIALLEQHGQGGNCGHLAPRFYHNSFIIADPAEAFVLETMARDWMVERVAGVRAISNAYSIAGLVARIHAAGWSRDAVPDYAASIADAQRDTISHGRARCARSTSLLRRGEGRLTATHMMAVLRDHGAAAPCLSIFKPVLPGTALPPHGPRPTDRFDPETLWWRHERLHRAMLGDFAIQLAAIRDERDALEAEFGARIAGVLDGGDAAARTEAVAACWRDAWATEDRWYAELDAAVAPGEAAYRASWVEMNRRAGVAA
jgi:secernin